ncbi:LPS export ABC transporter periplasmic protein LptC [Hydrogenivirga sp. 128-5-R1-1]|uniref:LPS export ABC transporter periplasmic protein LptC n=1 Tax=Hydrogenivirga sp. 128-5-R1-1 TaxID=392423 RepID=UPI00015F2E98|nr:LPS export ABC transporter periplasmic protein LptC [Hydrogenivirga sp. 128-5-R1-1]EDP73736.1 hypothetical protein HG1285_12277 [Hydrogenivirga sp. 128-5-R1-1]
MKKKALIYTFIFGIIALIINLINNQLEKSKIKNLSYKEARIYDFTLVSKNSKKIIVKGNILIDKIYYIEGKYINADIVEPDKTINIKADTGKFDKKKLVELQDNVIVSTKGLNLLTSRLIFNIKKSIAYNNQTNKIITKNMKTFGKHLFIDLKKEKIILKKVKTQVYGEKNG